jgi:predicted ATPase
MRGTAPRAAYQFKHALIRDAAYAALPKTRRRELHRRIASVIDRSFPEIAAARPELLAHHYTEAGLSAQAISCWRKAGQRAVERSAHAEAINHLARGLALLKTLDETPERAAEELTLQVTLGVPLGIARGYASPEVKTTYERARELCQHLGETRQLYPCYGRCGDIIMCGRSSKQLGSWENTFWSSPKAAKTATSCSKLITPCGPP